MAKINFNKLNLDKSIEVKTIDINDIAVEVKTYLPVDEKLELISHIVNKAHDEDYNFANPVKIEVYAGIGIVQYYTNISFTEKQLEKPSKIYDLLNRNKVLDKIIAVLPEEEYAELKNGIEETIKSVYQYQNSALGILDTIGQDYSDLNLEASEIQEKLADPQNMQLVKEILTKLG